MDIADSVAGIRKILTDCRDKTVAETFYTLDEVQLVFFDGHRLSIRLDPKFANTFKIERTNGKGGWV